MQLFESKPVSKAQAYNNAPITYTTKEVVQQVKLRQPFLLEVV